MSYKVFKLKNDQSRYPYKIMIYNPRNLGDPPEWFTDLLELDKIDNGKFIYCRSVDSMNNITYKIPSIGGHLNIPNDCLVIRNLGNNEVFSMRIEVFKLLYVEDITTVSNIKRCIKTRYFSIIRCIKTLLRTILNLKVD